MEMRQEDKERTAPDGEMVVLVPSFSGVRAMQLGVEFKPIDHPTEPRDNDQPVRCPMPEPSILNVSLLFSVYKNFCCY